MKANKAPEKLYVDAQDNFSDSMFYGFIAKGSDEDIEYVRKDAFIEKAVNWLINNTDITPTGIKNFRKAMKGE